MLRRFAENSEKPDNLNVSGCKTVSEAMAIFEKEYDAKVYPYDGSWEDTPYDKDDPKYFLCENLKTKFVQLIDVHIYRENEYGMRDYICVRQDLSTKVEDGDEISLGELVC